MPQREKSTVKNAPTCYRAPRWPDPDFPPRTPKKYTPNRNSGTARKYPENTQNGHFWYFGGFSSVFSEHFLGKFWESRISGRGVFFGIFRVNAGSGSVSGRGVPKSTVDIDRRECVSKKQNRPQEASVAVGESIACSPPRAAARSFRSNQQ